MTPRLPASAHRPILHGPFACVLGIVAFGFDHKVATYRGVNLMFPSCTPAFPRWFRTLYALRGRWSYAPVCSRTPRRQRRLPLPLEIECLERRALLSGTWQTLAPINPASGPTYTQAMLLLSDGTLMIQGGSPLPTNTWYRLTPDSTGNYVDGSWSSLASMNEYRYVFGSAVLPNGNVFVVGGAQSRPDPFTNTAEIFKPASGPNGTWTSVAPVPTPPTSQFLPPGTTASQWGEDPIELLSNGDILAGYWHSAATYLYNPSTNTWRTTAGSRLRNDRSFEESWVKLPDGSILSYDLHASASTGTFHAQRYIPSQDQWVDASTLSSTNPPSLLSVAMAGQEPGPAFLLPSGQVFYFGSDGNTAYYTPSTNTWTAGPSEPMQVLGGTSTQLVATDDTGAMMPNGDILIAFSPLGGTNSQGTYTFPPPSYIYEFNPTTQVFTDVTPSGLSGQNAVYLHMLMLPSGQVLLGDEQTGTLQVYTPDGSPQNAWRPMPGGITQVGDGQNTVTLTGTQLNGISEGASGGDDWQEASNYPLVQLLPISGSASPYLRTFNWSSAGVAEGSNLESVQLQLPSGDSLLRTVANGIGSYAFLNIEMSSTNNNVTLRVDPNNPTQLMILTSQYTDELPLASFQSIIVTGGFNTNNSLTVDYATGGFFPNPVTFDGGLGVGTNMLTITDAGDSTSRSWAIGFNRIKDTDLSTQPIVYYRAVQSVTLNGGSNGNTFNVINVPNVPLILNGNGGTSTLLGPNQANFWTLNAASGGVLDSNIKFNKVQSLVGGNGGDTFTLSSVLAIAMNLVLNSTGTLTTSSGSQTFAGAINTNNHLLAVAGGGTTTVQGIISGGGGLSMQGTGGLNLSVANSYTGSTTIASGMVVVSHNAALGAAGTSTTVNAGATLAFSSSFTYSTSESLFLNGTGIMAAGALENLDGVNTFAGLITLQSASTINSAASTLTLTGTLNAGVPLTVTGAGKTLLQGVISGAGGLTVAVSNGLLTLSASNTYTGNTTIVSGTLIITHDAALGAASTSTTVDTGATLALSGSFTYATNESLFLNGPGVSAAGALENLSGANTFAGPITLRSQSTIGSAAGSLTLSGSSLFNNGGFLLTVTGLGGNATISELIGGAGGLTVGMGNGTLTLSAANSYTGNTAIIGGAVIVNHDAALGGAGSTTTVSPMGTLALSGGFTYATSENLVLMGSGYGGTGALSNRSGANTFAGNITLEGSSLITSPFGGINLTGSLTNNGYLLTVSGPGATNLRGVLTGTGGLTLQGPGTLALTSANSYSGPTTVNGGTLVVNGSQPGSAVTVNAGSTLAGVGSVGALTIIGGTVIPGPVGGIGTLSAASADFSNAGTLLIRVPAYGPPGKKYDQLHIAGQITLGGASTLILDVNGLSKAGTAFAIVVFGSQSGVFTTVTLINNSANLTVALNYRTSPAELDAVFSLSPGAGAAPPRSPEVMVDQPWKQVGVPTNETAGAALALAGQDAATTPSQLIDQILSEGMLIACGKINL
jgi:autotransporter-associated beta strand protein